MADVIWHLETYDVTSIRASTPMYFLARKIKAMGVKMVLSGEGADEVFGGYLYFHNAPSPAEFHQEALRRVKNLHYFDLLRANKSTMAWGLEVRVPFLDKEFLDVAMNIRPEDKVYAEGKMEKHVLRKAFDTPEKPYLPDSILWRQKEQFRYRRLTAVCACVRVSALAKPISCAVTAWATAGSTASRTTPRSR